MLQLNAEWTKKRDEDFVAIDLNGRTSMETMFERELLSQGRLLNGRSALGFAAAERAAALFDDSVTHLVVAARGSSDNAAMYLQYLAGHELGLLVALATPSLYGDPQRIGLAGAAVLGISQSGRSPDIVSVLASARAQNRPTVAITNDESSPLALEADVVIPLLVGEELSLAATKTLLASMHAVMQLVQALASPREVLVLSTELAQVVSIASEWALSHVDAELRRLTFDGLTVVGRGMGLCSAYECALKVREVAGIRAEAYAAPDLLHGPIGAVGSGSTMWLQLTDEIDDKSARDLVVRAKHSGLTTLVSRTPSRASIDADVEIVLPVDSPNWMTPFLNVVVGQVMALRLGEQRSRPIDLPPGLQKVTLTN